MTPSVSVVTWNLQGSHGVDVDAVAEAIRELAGGLPDVVALQEVHRGQAARLAGALGLERRWSPKHWPIRHGVEGLAVLAAGRFLRSQGQVLQSAPFWSWRRRVMLLAEVETAAGPWCVVNVHLSPHGLGPQRLEQVVRLHRAAERFGPLERTVVVGDCNDLPGSVPHAALVAQGWRDAWRQRHGDAPGPTNWTEGPRRGRPPTQRLDYVFTAPGVSVGEAVVPDGDDRWASLSDHLPLLVRLDP